MATKWVYSFGKGKAEGKSHQKALLGGKGAGLAEMTNIGLPVPAGLTITTDSCASYYKAGKKWPTGLEKQLKDAIKKLEKTTKKKFGDRKNPLLVSVRSGAGVSMPGMMETVLNLGLNDEVVVALSQKTNNPRFAYDSYRRFIQMYSTVVCGLNKDILEEKLHALKEHIGVASDPQIPAENLRELCDEFKSFYQQEMNEPFPQDAYKQLVGAINAVFGSWNADKAITYRKVEKIVGLEGTAVNVQEMVFGNMGDDSGSGVAFTRDPSTGKNEFYGDLLINAQGEDVVAGIRTPIQLSDLSKTMPDVYDQLLAVRVILETHYKEMQDLEFTIEQGKLYMLQCRTGKRTAAAAITIAVEQATKPLLSKGEANRLMKKKYLSSSYAKRATKPVLTPEDVIARITPTNIEGLFYPEVDKAALEREKGSMTAMEAYLKEHQLARGINAVPGAAIGKAIFNAKRAEEAAAAGEKVVLVSKETTPDDVGGMHVASGILTATGGKTSHAAVVARGWGKCCIVGCDAIKINERDRSMSVNGRTIREGDSITLDGSDGSVYQIELPLKHPRLPEDFVTLMKWCDKTRRLNVRTNADTPADSSRAVELGAEGIGLCRTEHMFFETEERRLAIQEMIVADDEFSRQKALAKLLPYQRDDFVGIFEVMDGRPVTIRLLDPPLHEFLPKSEEQTRALSESAGVSIDKINERSEMLHESNPMLGHRGCRLAITYPEILVMQVQAIIEAAVTVKQRGKKVLPEIMIPLTIDAKELSILTDRVRQVAEDVMKTTGVKVPYLVGTMIETPRAALTADRLAEVAEFFSFGTNDLTQTVMGLSRDDAGRFLPEYVDTARTAIFVEDPFQSLDQEGVGLLVQWGIDKGRETNPKLKIGICGEHGGEMHSVMFCHRAGMDYVSCSPLRVPIARLAAAKAVLQEKSSGGKRSGSKAKAAGKSVRKRLKSAAKAKKSTKLKKPTSTKKKKAKKRARSR